MRLVFRKVFLGVGRPHIFPGLVQVSFWCLGGLWIVLGYVALVEYWPSCEVSCLDCLDPYGIYWIATHCVHPPYCFFYSRQVVDSVGLLERLLGFLAWFTWLPLFLCLHQRDVVVAALIPFSNENWFSSARDQNICLSVDLHFLISEDGDVAIIGSLYNAHQ